MLVPPVCLKIIKRNKNTKHTTLISKNERKTNKKKESVYNIRVHHHRLPKQE
jgi:hypothetical protein